MAGTDNRSRGGLSRRQFIGSAAAAGGAAIGGQTVGRVASALGGTTDGPLNGMNVVLFLTDQDRAIQHFPKGWRSQNLPGMNRLRANGLSFDRAFTNACMCSPARTTLASGYFPAQHGVKYTLEEDMPAGQYPQVEMPLDLPNLATVMKAAGYSVVYKGKWHLSKPAGAEWEPSDVAKYGFDRWNPPDAGANQDPPEAGGGVADNDGRFMTAQGDAGTGGEGTLAYITDVASAQQPFFLVVSLVNPHDVLFYPSTYVDAGYDDSWLTGEIQLPETVDEDLSTKPNVQRQFLRLFNLTGRLSTDDMKRNYLNFYGNLMKASDAYLVNVLDALEATGLLDDTLVIRTADHGEMGLAHGGLRQKNFNVYEESLRVPLVYSNQRLFGEARSTRALVSHVDLLPTLASLFGAPSSAGADWEGVDYSKNVLHPDAETPQDYIVFTYDDWQSGQASGPYPTPPNHLAAIREHRFKFAKYYDPGGDAEPEFEMYDLKRDPQERDNLARPGYQRTAEEQREYKRLRDRLRRVRRKRLQPL